MTITPELCKQAKLSWIRAFNHHRVGDVCIFSLTNRYPAYIIDKHGYAKGFCEETP
jgi:hypothetical protein